MLSWNSGHYALCDRTTRRGFLSIGSLTMGAAGFQLSLPQLLRAESARGATPTRKSIINIYLGGGPSHLDTFDLKPGAPQEIRGEFAPIQTKVSGFEICEHLPLLASCADQLAIIRSITGLRDEHSPSQSESGWSETELRSLGGRPGLGAVMSKVFGPAPEFNGAVAPTAVDLSGFTKPGFLGQVHSSYRPDGASRQNLSLDKNLEKDGRFSTRQGLLQGLDRLQRTIDAKGQMTAMDSFQERAVSLITSGQVAKALDVKGVPAMVTERFGIKKEPSNDRFLLAQRLIEAGVRSVSLSWGSWDTHGNNFQALKKQLPAFDQGVSALIEGLSQTGLLADTIVMISGEFGRTPRINPSAGRDHWSRASFFVVGGGGLKTGQIIGATNRWGEYASERPVHVQQVFATVFHQLGIDPETTLTDPHGRPQYLLDQRQLISELV